MVSCPHPDYLLEVLTQEQLFEWGRYLALEPLGFIADDARHATLLAHIARCAGSKTAKPSDYSMASQPEGAGVPDPSDGKAFVKHVKKVLATVKPRKNPLPPTRRFKRKKKGPPSAGE